MPVTCQLFQRRRSSWSARTVALSIMRPVAVGVTTMVTMARAPFTSVPSVQVSGPLPEHEPCDAVAETSVAFAGSLLVTTTLVASFGPASRTSTV